jgi:hypothetical protein
MSEEDRGSLEPIEWDEEVELRVICRVKGKSNPEIYEGDYHRNAVDAARMSVWCGIHRLERIDGFADLIGDVDIIEVDEW